MSISAVSFSKGFRGYDVAEVQAYVESVDQFAAASARNEQEMQAKIQHLELEVNRLREVESSLFRAMKLAEEAQLMWQQKVEKESEAQLANARKKAAAIVAESEQAVKKSALLLENERKQMLAQVDQELKEKQREMVRLEAVQQEIAGQLMELSQQTMDQIGKWTREVPQVEPVIQAKKNAEVAKKKAPAKVAKSVAKANEIPASKTKKANHLDARTIEDDGLPTLNKVLETYAKSSGPRGKVGDIN
jgi:cell division initiation protein